MVDEVTDAAGGAPAAGTHRCTACGFVRPVGGIGVVRSCPACGSGQWERADKSSDLVYGQTCTTCDFSAMGLLWRGEHGPARGARRYRSGVGAVVVASLAIARRDPWAADQEPAGRARVRVARSAEPAAVAVDDSCWMG